MQRETPTMATTTRARRIAALAMVMAGVLAGCSATAETEVTVSPVASPPPAEPVVASPSPSPSAEEAVVVSDFTPDEAREQARVLGFGPSPDGDDTAVYASTDGMTWILVAETEAPYGGIVLTDGSRQRLLAYQGIQHRQSYGYISEDRGLTWTLMGEQEFVEVNENVSPRAALGDEWFALLVNGTSLFAAEDAYDWQQVATLDSPFMHLHGTGDVLIALSQEGDRFATSTDGREWHTSELDLGGASIKDVTTRGDAVWILTWSNELWRADALLSRAELVSDDRNLRRVDSIAVIDDTTFVAVRVSPRTVLVSHDGGVTWEDRNIHEAPPLAVVVAVDPA